jgi:excisionase family DNA binding protein
VQWLRWRHKIPYPSTWAHDDELTVSQIAQALGVSAGTVYDWISAGKLAAPRVSRRSRPAGHQGANRH